VISVRIEELVLATSVAYPQDLAAAVESELAARLAGASQQPEGLAATIAAAAADAIREATA
jgi:hypothetical protein